MSLDIQEINGNGEGKSTEKGSVNLLSLASHELRTPLSVVKWYTEMILDGDAGPLTVDQTKYLRTIQTSNQRAIDLIRSLLNVSRLDLGTFSVNPEELDLRLIVKQILAENKVLLDEKKIRVDETYDGFASGIMPTLMADKQICILLLRTLISNAIIFSRNESVVNLRICEIRKDEECGSRKLLDDSLVFSVTDSGIGIPEEDKTNIFSKFFKASNAMNEDSKGAGLSLYITRLILDKTGGDVWFQSTQNTGSTFYISFPKRGMERKEGRTTLD